MPELPEVETTRRGIAPHIHNRRVKTLIVRQSRLRWPVPRELPAFIQGERVLSVDRRGKYLLLGFEPGTMLIHLGMSGSLRILPTDTPAGCHDHLDLVFSDHCLRLRDPRRFGAVLWTKLPPEQHPLLAHLGPEPLSDDFHGSHLHRLAQNRPGPVKSFIMNGKVVVGVGNIYANEALFLSGIHPRRSAKRIARARYDRLAEMIRQVLADAIHQGGTTLRDFWREDGNPGYFSQSLRVYGKAGQRCPGCGRTIRVERIGQRASYFCPDCQR